MPEEKPRAKLLGFHLKKIRLTIPKYRHRKKIAEDINEHPQTIYDIETGNRYPSIEILIKLQKAYHKSFEELLTPLLEMKKVDLEVESMINKIRNLLSMPEYKQAIKVMLDSMGPPEQLEKKRARGSPNLG